MKIYQTKRHIHNGGYTLIELMVSLMIFVIVVLACVSSLYSVNAASRRIQAMRSVMDNLNFAMESMSRTIRTSTNIICGDELSKGFRNGSSNCPVTAGKGVNKITMDAVLGNQGKVQYFLSGTSIMKKVDTGIDQPITANEIKIKRLVFYVDGADVSDGSQPQVIMLVQGEASAGPGNTATFSIQTLVSQRTHE